MTQELATYLADEFQDPDYFAKKVQGRWTVWCRASDHEVEFSPADLERAALLLFCRNA